jgi:hypothetical protein
VGAGSLWPTRGRLQRQGDGSIGGEYIRVTNNEKYILRIKMQRKPRKKKKGERKTTKNDF